MLGFQTESVPPVVCLSLFSGDAIQKVASVKLHTRLSGIDLHHSSRRRLADAGDQGQRSVLVVQDKVMVVSPAILNLLVGIIDPVTNPAGAMALLSGGGDQRQWTLVAMSRET